MVRAAFLCAVSAAIKPCLCDLDCTFTAPPNLDLWATNTQGGELLLNTPGAAGAVVTGVPVGVGTMATGRGLTETFFRRQLKRSVGDQVARDMEARLLQQVEWAGTEFAQMGDAEAAAVLVGDTVAPVIVMGGVVMLYNYMNNDAVYVHLMDNARITLDQLETAYGELVMAFLALPHPLSRLQHEHDRPILCRWREAARKLNQKIIDAEAKIRKRNDAYKHCWFWHCGSAIPDTVLVDLQDAASKAEDMTGVFNSFIDCYPHCARSVLSSDWHSIDDDAYAICEDVKLATCDFPGNGAWCHNADSKPCRRFSPTTASLLYEPPSQRAIPMRPNSGESDSCSGIVSTFNDFNDVQKLVRCTHDLISTQQMDLVKQRNQISVVYCRAMVVLIVALLTMFCQHRSDSDVDHYRRMDGRQGCWWNLACSFAWTYLPPVALALSATAIGMAIACNWALQTNLDMTHAVQAWLGTITLDVETLNTVSASHPRDMVFSNFSSLAHDISTAVVMAVQNSWQQQLPTLPAFHAMHSLQV